MVTFDQYKKNFVIPPVRKTSEIKGCHVVHWTLQYRDNPNEEWKIDASFDCEAIYQKYSRILCNLFDQYIAKTTEEQKVR